MIRRASVAWGLAGVLATGLGLSMAGRWFLGVHGAPRSSGLVGTRDLRALPLHGLRGEEPWFQVDADLQTETSASFESRLAPCELARRYGDWCRAHGYAIEARPEDDCFALQCSRDDTPGSFLHRWFFGFRPTPDGAHVSLVELY